MNDRFPDEWVTSDATAQFFGRLATAPLALLMLDYDGTLAPFVTDRLNAVPYPGVKERLERLLTLPRSRVVLISGRKASELQGVLNLSRVIEIWGSHGREHIDVDGSYQMTELTAYEKASLGAVLQSLEGQFDASVIETKPNSIAVHWRQLEGGSAAARAAIEERMQSAYRALPEPEPGEGKIELLPFDGGLELRAGGVTKGDAVLNILRRYDADTPAAFLGDDLTDEDAFQVMDGRGLAVLVREHPRASHAQLWLSPPSDLLHFLDAWIAAVEPVR